MVAMSLSYWKPACRFWPNAYNRGHGAWREFRRPTWGRRTQTNNWANSLLHAFNTSSLLGSWQQLWESGSGREREEKGWWRGNDKRLKDVSHVSPMCAEPWEHPHTHSISVVSLKIYINSPPAHCSCKCQNHVTASLPRPSPAGCSPPAIKKDSLFGPERQAICNAVPPLTITKICILNYNLEIMLL